MTIEVIDLRKGDRFIATEPISGTFGPAEIVIIDLSLGGAKLSHPQPLRIGTRGRIAFKRGDITVSTSAHVVWSHLSRSDKGMVYQSGMKLDETDPHYAMAINSLLRAGLLRKDVDSMERKRERLLEREQIRKTLSKPIPTSSGVE